MIKKVVSATILLIILMGVFGLPYAISLDSIDGLDDEVVTEEVTATASARAASATQAQTNRAANVANLFQSPMTDEGNARAQEIMSPIVKAGSVVFAVILSGIFLVMMYITLLDLLGISVPPLRKLLMGQEGEAVTQGAMASPGGFGGGAYGAQGGGMGYGMQPPQQQSSISKFFVRWMSDEAMAALKEANAGAQGGGFGGMGAQPQVKTKSVLGNYVKKRAVFLVLFGVATAVLTSTMLVATGTAAGYKILEIISGFIPIG